MNIETSLLNRNLIIKIKGEIDHHISEEVRDKVDSEYKLKNAKNIIFDFKNVTFMDSSGIGMVIGRYKNIEKQGGKVAICNISQNIERIFNMSGLQKIIKSYKTLDETLKSL